MKLKKITILTLVVAMFVSFSFATGTAKGKTIRLENFSGKIEVSSGSGKQINASEKMRIFDGYTVKTLDNSEAYLSLDDTKVIKITENTEIKIKKSWFSNKISVIAGKLFFNVTKPLESNESLNISTSTMSMGIRGTSGSIIADGNKSIIQIYNGRVAIAGANNRFYINAGEQALSDDDLKIIELNGDGSEIPSFVLNEINNDDELKSKIKEETNLDVDNFSEQENINSKEEQKNKENARQDIEIAKQEANKEKQSNKKSSTTNKSVTGKSSAGSSSSVELTWGILSDWISQNPLNIFEDFISFATDYTSSLNISGYNNLTNEEKMNVQINLVGNDDGELQTVNKLLEYEKMAVLESAFNSAVENASNITD